MKLKDHLPLKAVSEDLGVSRWTLWRAARSQIGGFPQPLKIGRQLYWKKADLAALETALMRFEGRCAFDRKRDHERKVKSLRARPVSETRSADRHAEQRDLFSS